MEEIQLNMYNRGLIRIIKSWEKELAFLSFLGNSLFFTMRTEFKTEETVLRSLVIVFQHMSTYIFLLYIGETLPYLSTRSITTQADGYDLLLKMLRLNGFK